MVLTCLILDQTEPGDSMAIGLKEGDFTSFYYQTDPSFVLVLVQLSLHLL